MAEGNEALKEEAASNMEAARRELAEQTPLLLHELNPARVVRHVWHDHALGICIGAGVLGMALAFYFAVQAKSHAAYGEPVGRWR